jgi:hypothetical protein
MGSVSQNVASAIGAAFGLSRIERLITMQAISETSVCRLAARMGYSVMKSRTRDENRLDHGGFMLIDVRNNAAVIGAHPFAYSASLEEIEAWLRGGNDPRRYRTNDAA